MMTTETSGIKPLIPGWENVPETPPELREPWEKAKEILRGQINRLAFRAFVDPAQLLSLETDPPIAVLGIIPSAEMFYSVQAEAYVTTALREVLGVPVEFETQIFRHEPDPSPTPTETPSDPTGTA